MKRLLFILTLCMPLWSLAAEYHTSLVVQTGELREGDLIVRTISDLESNKICLAFYIRTTGTSPEMSCYDTIKGFRSNLAQVGHYKEGTLVVRKLKDSVNRVSCLVAYVSTPGTSPSIDCYRSKKGGKDAIVRSGHLREGDLDVHRILDPDSTKTCLIAYVRTHGTAPSLVCYDTRSGGKGGMQQTNQMREGDLIVRKVVDDSNSKACLVTYVSTEGTRSHLYCFDEGGEAGPAKAQWRPRASGAKTP